jgi:hypothetical protein
MREAKGVSAMMLARGRWVRGATLMLGMALLASAGACSVFNKKTDEGAVAQEPATIRVENQAFLDMNIYVWRSSQRLRLGTVTGNSTARFKLPNNIVFGSTPLRFQADPIGGNRQPLSQEITVSPGDEVVLTIPPS